MTNALALELRNIARHFGSVVALDDASVAVKAGSVHALLGENGAGKTTLMRVAFGMLQPHAGTISVLGQERRFGSAAEAIAAGIGMVQQHPANVPAMSVWENAFLGGHGRLRPSAARERVRALATTLGFALDPDARVSDLSVASQQRLEILKAINREARILILDEPTAILAPDEARDLYGWLRSFAAGGGTAIVITHKLEEARAFTDELTVLRAGRAVLTAPSNAVSAAELTRAMIGAVETPEDAPTDRQQSAEFVVRASGIVIEDERRVPVIRSATFDVHAGEIVGVAGVEGSGHHHLLLVIAGRHPVTSGKLMIPRDTGFVPEDRHRDAVVPAFSLEENVAIRGAGARRGRLPWAAIRSRTTDLVATYDVRAMGPRDPLSSLSGGNQQKVVLARELDGQPALIVVENPTRGLDVRAARFVREQLRAARDRGIGVVLYSSDLDEITGLSDRVLVVHAGEVVEVPRDPARIGAAMLGAA